MLLTRRSFFDVAGVVVLGAAALALPGCGESRGASQATSAKPASASTASASSVATTSAASESARAASSVASTAAKPSTSNTLVLYFSRAGENYGVGVVEKGNTAIVAEMIAQKTGADLFEVEPAEAYPESYDECCDVALGEKNSGARPAYAGDIDLAPYDTVYLGYPIWWGELPMCLFTFLEAHDWSGKSIRPFCTHAGSGLAGTVSSIQTTCTGANVEQGLSIEGTTAQNSRDQAQAAVDAWVG